MKATQTLLLLFFLCLKTFSQSQSDSLINLAFHPQFRNEFGLSVFSTMGAAPKVKYERTLNHNKSAGVSVFISLKGTSVSRWDGNDQGVVSELFFRFYTNTHNYVMNGFYIQPSFYLGIVEQTLDYLYTDNDPNQYILGLIYFPYLTYTEELAITKNYLLLGPALKFGYHFTLKTHALRHFGIDINAGFKYCPYPSSVPRFIEQDGKIFLLNDQGLNSTNASPSLRFIGHSFFRSIYSGAATISYKF